jgi:putative DNA-invertase from lambdoid prophage Rac
MKRAAIYVRVSTHNGQNLDTQLDELREYCLRRGWKILREYAEEGISRSKEHRPALDRLLAECRKRLVGAVVVYRYDRFARSLRQLVNALDEFRAMGIYFVSLH